MKVAVLNIAVFCNTGCRPDNIARKLAVSDGAVVGSFFKKDGKFTEHVDVERVRQFMAAVQQFRDTNPLGSV